ncbi:hypothetical protein ACIRJO_02810 [Streptomyces sp. NPDC102394]|uniref:hypothetical protein n=1 Tax=Streptomyces sp. NPDC102394 TaxID=3366167 RepID=UPI0037FB6EB5
MIRTTIVEAVKRELSAYLRARTAWDERPAVYTLHQAGAAVHMSHVPIPDLFWTAYGHPPTAVRVIAEAAPRMPRLPDGSHMLIRPAQGPLIGLAFHYEAYALTSDSPHPAVQEAARRRQAGGSTPRFKDVPGRIERRCMTAVDLDGGRYMVSSSRIADDKPDAADPVAHYLAFADPARDTLSGKVVDAVIQLLNAIKPLPVKEADQ